MEDMSACFLIPRSLSLANVSSSNVPSPSLGSRVQQCTAAGQACNELMALKESAAARKAQKSAKMVFLASNPSLVADAVDMQLNGVKCVGADGPIVDVVECLILYNGSEAINDGVDFFMSYVAAAELPLETDSFKTAFENSLDYEPLVFWNAHLSSFDPHYYLPPTESHIPEFAAFLSAPRLGHARTFDLTKAPATEYFTLPHPQALESTGIHGIYWVSRDPEMAKISAKFTNQNPKNSIGPFIDIHRPNRICRNPWNNRRHTYSQPRTPKWLLLLLI